MCQMKPSLWCFNRCRSFTVLHLLDGVVVAAVDDLCFLHRSSCHVIDECSADALTITGIDETVLGTGVEGILSIYELGMKHHVALLAGGNQVGQALPGDQFLRAYDAGCRLRP